MTPEPPAPTPRRKRRYLRWLGVLLLGCFAYGQWKAYDYRAAVKEAQALGWMIDDYSSFDDIKEDWHAAFRMETWTRIQRSLQIQELHGYTSHQSLLLRLNPQFIIIFKAGSPFSLASLKDLPDLRGLTIENSREMTDANMDQIEALTELRTLQFVDCPRLTHLNRFIRLKKLELLTLWSNQSIPMRDIEAFKAAHPNTAVDLFNIPPANP